MKPFPSILHLLPHAGGGVGTVLRVLLDTMRENDTAVASLEPLNAPMRAHCRSLGIPWTDGLTSAADMQRLDALVASADVVLVHWWNHPLLMRLLVRGLPPSRVVLWSHVNGYHPPQAFFPELFDFPDVFVMASEASQEAPSVENLPAAVKDKLRVIRSCAGIPPWAADIFRKRGPVRVGYVGTVEDAKMHKRFLDLCAEANPAEPCLVAGGPAHEELRARAARLGLADRFCILGPVADPLAVYEQIHVFAYPLNPRHYGTGEQVLIEAMAAGCVPVVFANPPERAIVRHDETGLVANTPDDFSRALGDLVENRPERDRLAAAGRRFVIQQCGIHLSVRAFRAVFDHVAPVRKQTHRLVLPTIHSVPRGSPCHMFLTSCGETEERNVALEMLGAPVAEEVIPPSFLFPTRGSPQHYLRTLGPDGDLERICRQVTCCVRKEALLHG